MIVYTFPFLFSGGARELSFYAVNQMFIIICPRPLPPQSQTEASSDNSRDSIVTVPSEGRKRVGRDTNTNSICRRKGIRKCRNVGFRRYNLTANYYHMHYANY